MPDKPEILPVRVERREAAILINAAIAHFREAKRATIQVMADMRRLQDNEVHLLYGEKNFANWASSVFEGLAAPNVRQLCRAGAVALELDRRGLIDLAHPKGIGTTGLRELSVVSSTYGNDKMAEVFVTAQNMLEGKGEVTGVTVESAMRVLMPPAAVDVAEKTQTLTEETDAEYDEPDTEYSAKVNELIDHIRDLSYDLPESLADITRATMQLRDQLNREKSDTDQTWIEGTR